MYIWSMTVFVFFLHQPFTVISKPRYVTGRHGRQEVPPTPASVDQHRLNVQALVHHNPVCQPQSKEKTLQLYWWLFIFLLRLCFYDAYFRSQSFILFDEFSVNVGVWGAEPS